MPLNQTLLGAATRAAMGGLSLVQAPRLSILIFHRVLPAPDPIFPHEVDAARFDALMAAVAQGFQVLSLPQAVSALQQDRLPARALAITFDDGYEDNLTIALPILQRHGLPACFFIATGFMDGGLMFNDQVIECVRASPREAIDLADLGLGRLAIASPADKARAIGAVLKLVKYQTPAERPDALARLGRACQPRGLPDRLMMRPAQVQQLRAAGMDIGVHTVNHPILARVDDRLAEAELSDSRSRLESLLGEPTDLLAYPNGGPDRDYDERHVAMARRLGFRAAVTTAAGVSMPGADLMQLPRFTPWDQDPLRWMARLVRQRADTRYQLARAPAEGLRATAQVPEAVL